MTHDVLVIGGGLAGLATATMLASSRPVTLLEARPQLGGRASSFSDPHSGLLIDHCQHVIMGCCTNLASFFHTLGVASLLQPQLSLYFMTPDGHSSSLAADPLPAPFHLLRAFLTLHTLSVREKARLARALASLYAVAPDADGDFLPWLRHHGQSERTIDRFWSLVLVSALNDRPENVGLRYARKVFVDGFLRHRYGWQVFLPTVPLVRLYGERLQAWFHQQRVRLRLQTAVRNLVVHDNKVTQVVLRSGEILTPSWVVAAVPFDRLLKLLPDACLHHSYFAALTRLHYSPITSLHLWFDRPVMPLPHVVLVDAVSQWVFNRGRTPSGDFYVQVVVSASRALCSLSHDDVQTLLLAELQRPFPAVATAQLRHARVITEHRATFCPVPGVDRWRPKQRSPIDNLFLAGDWTATGWPGTMESAVRSGYLAAEALCERLGHPRRFLQPDL